MVRSLRRLEIVVVAAATIAVLLRLLGSPRWTVDDA
jgi:hypothetical protein